MSGALAAWSHTCPRPLVVFLDEIDALQDDVLLSVLRQLRGAYSNRPRGFPWSLGLIGLRDVRDYKVKSGGSPYLHTASPFNIKARSVTSPATRWRHFMVSIRNNRVNGLRSRRSVTHFCGPKGSPG